MAEQDADDLIEIEDLEEEELLEEDAAEELEDDLEEVAPPPEKKPLSKAARTIIKLRQERQTFQRENQELREAVARTDGAVQSLTRTMTAPNAEQLRQEQERLAAMTPEERIEFRIGQERQNISGALAQQGFQTADTIDAMRFERLCEKNPAYDGVSAEVDKRLGELRAKGQNVERKILANVVLGEKAAAAAGKKTVKAVVRTKAKAGAGSDVPGDRTRTRQPKTARERLENVKF